MSESIKLTCVNCSHIYFKPPSIANRSKTNYCSRECFKIHAQNNAYGKIQAICKTCNKEFKFNRAELNKTKGAGSFCSRECQANGRVFVICPVCDGEFKTSKSNVKRGHGKYCSKLCFNKKTNVIEKFFKSISLSDHPTGCWIWEGKKDSDGYGIIYIKKNIRAHRFSYELFIEKIPNHLLACHHCDNPTCVNPNHLFIGTALDNARDRDSKNRGFFKVKLQK